MAGGGGDKTGVIAHKKNDKTELRSFLVFDNLVFLLAADFLTSFEHFIRVKCDNPVFKSGSRQHESHTIKCFLISVCVCVCVCVGVCVKLLPA